MAQNRHDPNYLRQINAFHRWLGSHYLSSNARLLWFMLIQLCNLCGWEEWVQLDTMRMMVMLGVQSQNAALRARDALVDAGLLTYEKGRKGSPNRYRMIFFTERNESESERESACRSGEKTDDINKQEINKTKDKQTSVPAELREAFDAYAQMRRKMRKPLTESAEKLVMQALETLAPERTDMQKQILEQSILNGWTGVYPLKAQDQPDRPASYDVEEMERKLLYGKIEYRKRE